MLLFIFCTAAGQETSRRPMPVFVSHLSAENRALLRRKAAPRHTFLTKAICFNMKCRGFIGWRRKQRSMRFRGYKDGGALPRPIETPLLKVDTVITRRTGPTSVSPEERERTFILDDVLFERNSARLNEEFTFRLDSLADLLLGDATLRASIRGYTDNTGAETHNLRLSAARAQAVAEYLVESNVGEKRITFEGFGSSNPVASNATEEGRRRNRRVEITISRN